MLSIYSHHFYLKKVYDGLPTFIKLHSDISSQKNKI
jgi:hypothetical protein